MNSIDSKQFVNQHRWIKTPNDLQVSEKALVRFRGVVRLDRVPVDALFLIAASGPYKLYLNGIHEGRGPLSSGSDCIYQDNYNLEGKLKRGTNIIGIEMLASSKPCLVNVRLCVTTRADDLEFTSDESWVCSIADDYTVNASPEGQCENYNDSGKPGEWLGGRFGARGWSLVAIATDLDSVDIKDRPISPAAISLITPAYAQAFNVPDRPKDAGVAESFQQVIKGDVTLLKVGSVVGLEAIANPEERKVIKTPRGDRGVAIILDFDKSICGKLGISFESAGSGVADVFFATSQPDDGGVPIPDTGLGMMRVNFRKGEIDVRSFVPRQARFIQIEFRRCSKPVTLKTVDIEVASFASDRNTHFECNRGTLSGLWEQCAERATNLLGSVIGVNATAFTLNATTFAAISRSVFYLYGDTGITTYLLDSLESWCDDPLDAPWILLTYSELTGDSSRLSNLYDAVDLHLDKMWGSRNADGLVELSGKVRTLPNLKLCRALESMSAAAWLCGREIDAYAHRDKAVVLRKAILNRLFDDRKGLFCSGLDGWHKIREYTTEVNLEAVCAGVLDQYQRSRVYHWLTRPDLETALSAQQTLVLATQLVADMQLDGAMEVVGSKLGSSNGTGSEYDLLACAGLSAVVGGVLGVRRVLGTLGRYSVSPVRLGLKQADSSVVTNEGELLIGWRGTRNGTLIQIDVPENARIDVYIGDDFGNSFRLNGRTLVNGCVSLSAGSHRIHCSDVSVRRPASDKSLAPEVPWASVEVLDSVSQYGVRQRLARGGDRRRRKDDEPVSSSVDIQPNVPSDIEAVETLGELADGKLLSQVPNTPELQQDEKPKRRRRGGRGRKPEEESVQPVIETAEQLTGEPDALPESELLVQTAEETAIGSKPKRRRRTRRRKPAESIEGIAVEPKIDSVQDTIAESVEIPSEVSEAEENSLEIQPETRSKRRRRSRSRRKSSEPVTEDIADSTTLPDEKPIEEQVEEPTEVADDDSENIAEVTSELSSEPRSRRRRRSRGRRKPGCLNESVVAEFNDDDRATGMDAEENHLKELSNAEDVQIEDSVETRSKRRRRSRSRRKQVEQNEETVFELETLSTDEQASEAEPVSQHSESDVTQLEVSVDTIPRSRRRTTTRRNPVEPVESDTTIIETTVVDTPEIVEAIQDSIAEIKPKSRRNNRSRKQPAYIEDSKSIAELDTDPFVEPVIIVLAQDFPMPVENVTVPEEPKLKQHRRTSRKKPEVADFADSQSVVPMIAESSYSAIEQPKSVAGESDNDVKKPKRRKSPSKINRPTEINVIETVPEPTNDKD